AEIELQIAVAIKHGVSIHAITSRSPADWVKSVCDRTGGILVSIGDGLNLAAEFRRLYSALTNHYRIRYREEAGATTVLRVQVYSSLGRGECSTSITAASQSLVSV